MNLGLKLFLGYFLIVGIGVYFSLNILGDELKPAFRQAAEETLIDSANLLAVLVRDDVLNGSIADGRFQSRLEEYARRVPAARIWGIVKNSLDHRIYITDAQGIVIFDSSGQDQGQDYSRWNDVYLTLRGQYGARTTRIDPNEERSSVMYVAAPIRDGARLIGTLTVAKPSASVQPYVDRAEAKLHRAAAILVLVSLTVGWLFSWSLARSIQRLAAYARAAAEGRRGIAPKGGGPELRALAEAVETMRDRLEGRDYVERYVHTLTHEMKSPLAAISGAAELLQGTLPEPQRERFAALVASEAGRLQRLVERLLALATVEQRREPLERRPVALRRVVEELLASRAPLIARKALRIEPTIPEQASVLGEPFLLIQAIGNLLDNALEFTPPGGRIDIAADIDGGCWRLTVFNTGSAIPDYAHDRLFERFYSLPRPDTGQKSTGLGLAFVREVAQLHGGTIRVDNRSNPDGSTAGVVAGLRLPVA
ncbi:MAG TPA: two-component system sensor histidine kinase CreC [Candidatus Competibacteraceae bacterium]|nr:MAG: two-component system sensor histidine kinase CreC [Candidatus Competibacteraceae bacterium]HOB62527.1 two-component system sensor histidine kinase CreC [Candidatus Competibacteraceae bacterium]HQA25577.1 two-component system sensor histidine kinase CreC [Candidatus Competibacteraceae bacterium]HQD56511.1 two-component system sensor histidine kinase CreC [Candidatus Competibacteraceae bacterium]